MMATRLRSVAPRPLSLPSSHSGFVPFLKFSPLSASTTTGAAFAASPLTARRWNRTSLSPSVFTSLWTRSMSISSQTQCGHNHEAKEEEDGVSLASTIEQINELSGSVEGIKKLDQEQLKKLHALCSKAAEEGHSGAALLLGTLISEGLGTVQDHRSALQWYKKAASAGAKKSASALTDADRQVVPMAQFAVGMSYATGDTSRLFHSIGRQNQADMEKSQFVLGPGYVIPRNASPHGTKFDFRKWLREERRRNFLKKKASQESEQEKITVDLKKAKLWLTASAENEYTEAQLALSYMLLHGPLDKNVSEAVELLESASKNNSITALYELGRIYYDGDFFTRDNPKSLSYFKRAATLGDANAHYWLGFVYHTGLGLPRDDELALKHLMDAADQNHPGALFYLSQMYRIGQGAEAQPELMWKYLNKAVELEDSDALFSLADIYYHGTDGKQKDYPKALQYYALSARQGNPDAFVNEGAMYFNGMGTEVNYEKAFYAYQKATILDEEHAAALWNLAHMYEQGIGVAKNADTAKYYRTRATEIQEQQDEKVRSRIKQANKEEDDEEEE